MKLKVVESKSNGPSIHDCEPEDGCAEAGALLDDMVPVLPYQGRVGGRGEERLTTSMLCIFVKWYVLEREVFATFGVITQHHTNDRHEQHRPSWSTQSAAPASEHI
jgi:hypothetical protein